jgi:hypothetical protein
VTGVLNEVSVAGSLLPVSRQVKSLGVTQDTQVLFETHVSNVVRACNYHSRALSHIRNMLTTDVAKAIACNIVSSRLDYCNSLLYGAPTASIETLQRAQNSFARVVLQIDSHSSAKPLPQSLHWLPVQESVHRKMALLAYKIQEIGQPPNLQSLLQQHTPARSLRRYDTPRINVPRTRTEFGKWAFSVAAPSVWNELPDSLRQCRALTTFKKQLKTCLFIETFHPNVC